MRILCLGTSYTGRYAAVNFSKTHTFYFLSRRPGFYKHVSYFDPKKHKEIDCILDTIPPVIEKDAGNPENPLPQEEPKPPYFQAIQKLVAKGKRPGYVYISSTALFPTCLGKEDKIKVFDEKSQSLPETERGQRRLQSEIMIRQNYPWAKILRSTGIYGPGRSLAKQFWEGNFSRAKCGNRFVSRIHVHDLLRLAFALGEEAQSPPLVHAVDEKTESYKEVFSFLEQEFSLSIPGNWRDSSPKGRIIRSLFAKELLGGVYRFPSYREGFRALVPKTRS